MFLVFLYYYLQVHDSYFGDKHETISIQTYELSPGKYKNVFCELHNRTIEIACEDCKKLVCNSCGLNYKDCAGKQCIICVVMKRNVVTWWLNVLQFTCGCRHVVTDMWHALQKILEEEPTCYVWLSAGLKLLCVAMNVIHVQP